MNFSLRNYKLRKMLSFIVFIFAFIPMGGCVELGYDHEMKIAKAEKEKNKDMKIFDGEEEPPFPNLEVSNQTIHGIDANKNGLRDDIEIWINRTKKDEVLRKLAKKQARAFFKKMKIAERGNVLELINSSKRSKDRIELELIQETLNSIIGCLHYMKYSPEIRQEHIIKNTDLIYNTDARKAIEQKSDQITSVITFRLDPKKEDCEFVK